LGSFKKTCFCVGIKTKELLEANGFTVDVYLDYASELAEIITLIYNKESLLLAETCVKKLCHKP
jgi:uroporphyrinogen-III synthase